MPEDPVLEVTKAQRALQALLRELENLKAEVGKYSAASRALEPAVEAMRGASVALSTTSDRFSVYARAVADSDLVSISESARSITAEISTIRTVLEETQKQLANSAASVSKLTDTVLTRERLVEELGGIEKSMAAADVASKARNERLAELVLSQSAAMTAASSTNHGQTHTAIERSTSGVRSDIQGAERTLTARLDGVLEQVRAVQAAGNVLRTLVIVGALIAFAAAVFSFLGWRR